MEVYLNPWVQRKVVKHGLGMVATSEINKGEIISIDRVLQERISNMAFLLPIINSSLVDELYPRLGTLYDKIVHNSFLVSNDTHEIRNDKVVLLGHTLSFYNHDCCPNGTRVYLRAKVLPSNEVDDYVRLTGSVLYVAVIANRDIAEREEICISYGSSMGHETFSPIHKIKCLCPTSAAERLQLIEDNCKYASVIANRSYVIRRIIDTDMEENDMTVFSTY